MDGTLWSARTVRFTVPVQEPRAGGGDLVDDRGGDTRRKRRTSRGPRRNGVDLIAPAPAQTGPQ